MVGGLVLSQMLTLFTTPIVYLYLDRTHYWYESRKKARQARKAAKAARDSINADGTDFDRSLPVVVDEPKH